MIGRKAGAEWKESLKQGSCAGGGDGTFEERCSFASRFESGGGTNPDELIGAAHAGCFSKALSLVPGHSGGAEVHPHLGQGAPRSAGLQITRIELMTAWRVERSCNLAGFFRDQALTHTPA